MMSELLEETILVKNDDLIASQVGDEAVMMSIKDAKYFGLNATGLFIWNLLSQPVTYGEICESIQRQFNISKSQCSAEVKPFIEELLSENIILQQSR